MDHSQFLVFEACWPESLCIGKEMSIEDWRFLINYLGCKRKVVPAMHTSRVLVLQCRNGASLQALFQDEAVSVIVSWWQIYSV
jgi:hypothetical protein